MKVFEVGIRMVRKIQIRDFEPMEVEVSMKAQIEDGENHAEAGQQLVTDTRDIIKVGFENLIKRSDVQTITVKAEKVTGKTPKAKEEKTSEPEKTIEPEKETEPAKRGRGRPPGAKNKDKITGKESKKDMDEVPGQSEDETSADEVPGEETLEKHTEAEAGVDEEVKSEEESDGVMPLQDFKDWFTGVVSGGKISVKQMKEILSGFDATRAKDVKPESRQEVIDQVELISG